MNIKILDSWLREFLKTSANSKTIAEKLSLTSVSVEKIEKFKNDYIYDIEVTTNRPDLMSVIGIAHEAATILPQSGIDAIFLKPTLKLPDAKPQKSPDFHIYYDSNLVNRICAVIIEVSIKQSPQFIKDRLEASGIRSLNNVIDITNYVMRETGHPTHVFDYDRLSHHTLSIRESKLGEKIKTLDDKEYTLIGGDIIADNGKGEIVDLISIMGTANSVVTNTTKRIVYFIDNVDPHRLRKTSMTQGIRTEAVILNEKGINPELAGDALARGIELFQTLATGEVISQIFDIYPHPPVENTITITEEKINKMVGIEIPLHVSKNILTNLGFIPKEENNSLIVTIPKNKSGEDMQIPEDLIEEIARVYGYENIPDTLPSMATATYLHLEKNEFYWEDRIKDALKYWGFTEVYTYPMVSSILYDETTAENLRVKILNPLNDDMVYMRSTLLPSLYDVIEKNQEYAKIKIFEIGNVYTKNGNSLPNQTLMLAGIIKNKKTEKDMYYEVKLLLEDLLNDLGITDIHFIKNNFGDISILCSKKNNFNIGTIKIADGSIGFEINLPDVLTNANLKKVYTPISKYPPIIEDLAIIAPKEYQTGDLIEAIRKQHSLIKEVSLLDTYQDARTFHIVYQSDEKNLNDKVVGEIRNKIHKMLIKKLLIISFRKIIQILKHRTLLSMYGNS